MCVLAPIIRRFQAYSVKTNYGKLPLTRAGSAAKSGNIYPEPLS
jgi:hypothetical protein